MLYLGYSRSVCSGNRFDELDKKIDLKNHQIEWPENGFFIAMEWLQTNDYSYLYESKWKKIANKPMQKTLRKEGFLNSKIIGYGQILGYYELESNNGIWGYTNNDIWRYHKSDTIPMIRCKIKIWD